MLMHAGKIVAGGSPRELKDKHGLETLEDVFIHLIEERVQDERTREGRSEGSR
jgi:ABC-type Na+ transport system ATPase subunit NatA